MATPKTRATAPKRHAASPKRGAATKRRRETRKPLPPWLLLGVGLFLGVICAPLALNVAKKVDWAGLWSKASAPVTAIAPELPSVPRFDFYTILPNQEVVVPDPAPPAERKAKPDEKKAPAAPQGVYYLQAGSFRKIDEANGRRAQVILLGTEASIQSVTIDRDTWHRVRIGPYGDLERLREARRRLRENNIDTLLIRAHR